MPYKKDGVTFDYVEAQNHRTVWVGRDLKAHLIPLPCHGNTPSHQPRLFPDPSSLTLSTARDGVMRITAKLPNIVLKIPLIFLR